MHDHKRQLTVLHAVQVFFLGLILLDIPIQLIHLLPEVSLLLQLPLAAALRAEAVGLHALVAPVGAATLIAVLVDLRSIVQGSEAAPMHGDASGAAGQSAAW